MSDIATPPAEKTKRDRTPMTPVARVHDTPEAMEAARTKAVAEGHSKDVRKFKVALNGKSVYVLGYNPAHAVGSSWEKFGILVEEIDPTVVKRGLTPKAMAEKLKSESAIASLSKADLDSLIAALNTAAKNKKK